MLFIVASIELSLNLLEDDDVTALAQGRLERKDNLPQIKVFALQQIVGILQATGFLCDVVVGFLELLDRTLHLLQVSLLTVSERSLSSPVLLLAYGRRGGIGLATRLFSGPVAILVLVIIRGSYVEQEREI